MIRSGKSGERAITVYLFALLALSPPFLAIFSTDARPFGIPLLYFYLFAVWGAVIALVAWIAERKRPDIEDAPGPGSGPTSSGEQEAH